MRRQTILLLSTMRAALMLASGAALAQATFNKVACGGGTCLGTSEADWIGGTDGPDKIIAKAGDDLVHAGGGKDVVFGLGGTEHMYGGEGEDELRGGGGKDFIFGGLGATSCSAALETMISSLRTTRRRTPSIVVPVKT